MGLGTEVLCLAVTRHHLRLGLGCPYYTRICIGQSNGAPVVGVEVTDSRWANVPQVLARCLSRRAFWRPPTSRWSLAARQACAPVYACFRFASKATIRRPLPVRVPACRRLD